MLTYEHKWEFILGRVFLAFWVALSLFAAFFAVKFMIEGNNWWLFESVLAVWSIFNVVRFVREVRYNDKRSKK